MTSTQFCSGTRNRKGVTHHSFKIVEGDTYDIEGHGSYEVVIFTILRSTPPTEQLGQVAHISAELKETRYTRSVGTGENTAEYRLR